MIRKVNYVAALSYLPKAGAVDTKKSHAVVSRWLRYLGIFFLALHLSACEQEDFNPFPELPMPDAVRIERVELKQLNFYTRSGNPRPYTGSGPDLFVEITGLPDGLVRSDTIKDYYQGLDTFFTFRRELIMEEPMRVVAILKQINNRPTPIDDSFITIHELTLSSSSGGGLWRKFTLGTQPEITRLLVHGEHIFY